MDTRIALALIAVAAVVLIMAGTFLVDDREEDGISATIVDAGTFNSYKLDVPRDELYANGFDLGDRLTIRFPDSVCYAYFICDHSGIASLDMFVNVYSQDQDVEIGIYDYDISLLYRYGAGTEISISKEGGKSPYYDKIPHYSAGYSNDREDFSSDQEYGNYREVVQGDILRDRLYRSASPMQQNGTRYLLCDEFLREAGADWVFSISIDMEEVEGYRYPGSYAFDLYDQGRMVARSLNPAVLCH